jgi:intracellular multiplication protein IcmD
MSENLTLGTVSAQITSSYGSLAQLITAGSYVAGSAFAIASMAKFKGHKDNPTQVPIGTPLAMEAVSAALLFIPSTTSG